MTYTVLQRLFLLSFVIVLSKCSEPEDTLLFVGDSMTGQNVDQQYTFTALLERQMNNYRIIDQGKPGWTTDSFLEAWDETSSDFPSGTKFIFIQLGIDDLIVNGHNESTITNCMNNMQLLITKMKNDFPNAEIVLLSNTRIDYGNMDHKMKSKGFDPFTNEYLSQIAEGFTILAADNKCNFLDLHRQVPIKSTIDGLHLNKNGHNIVASIISKFMREWTRVNQIETQ